MIHVVLVCVINEVAPLTTFRCELVEEGLRGVAAGAALEMDDLILAVSRAPADIAAPKAYHATVSLECTITPVTFIHLSAMRELVLCSVSMGD